MPVLVHVRRLIERAIARLGTPRSDAKPATLIGRFSSMRRLVTTTSPGCSSAPLTSGSGAAPYLTGLLVLSWSAPLSACLLRPELDRQVEKMIQSNETPSRCGPSAIVITMVEPTTSEAVMIPMVARSIALWRRSPKRSRRLRSTRIRPCRASLTNRARPRAQRGQTLRTESGQALVQFAAEDH